MTTGDLARAIAQARALLAHDPHAADRQAREILKAAPGHPTALTLLARAMALTDRDAEALALVEQVTTGHPHFGEAWRTLGDLRYARGDDIAAGRAHARAIVEAVHDPGLRHAANALAAGDLPVAERLLKPHLADHPTDVAAMRMLAELAGRLGRNLDAEMLLRRALELAPDFAPARHNLAIVLHRQHRAPDALAELDRLLEEDPDNPAYRNLLGAVLGGIGAYDAALEAFTTALQGRPNNATLWMSYGHTLKTLGRRSESITAYRRSIELRPVLGEAWWSLANLKTVDLGSADIAAMERGLEDRALSPDDRFHLHFALGKAQEDSGNWAEAFGHYAEGNRLRRERIHYDADETHALVERSRALFTPAFFAAREGQGAADPAPIFILGMPRSGSTLVEQILASHSQVEGTRELPDIQAIAHRLSGRTLRGDRSLYPEAIADLSADDLRALGEEYLARTRIHRKTNRPFFIDKMPNNWAHVGLIRLILPNATIIDTRRHPLGCCFSNFKQHFARGQAFAYALDDLGHYYADYVAAMRHIDAVLPGHVHRIFHEDMVEDTEAQVRALLDACGLPFEPATLRFWETERAVQTASSEQVRQPIFREGLDQWRHFAPWLGPLETALGDALAYR